MIKCELCSNRIKINPALAPPDYNFQLIDGWAFCNNCKIKLLQNGVTE